MIDSNFKMEYKNIRMIKGDTVSFGVDVRDSDGNLVNLDSMTLTVKKIRAGNEALFQKTLGDGVTKRSDGYVIRIAPWDTKYVKPGKYLYDIKIGVNSDIFTINHGLFEIENDITTL
jgi:hypothetical protein